MRILKIHPEIDNPDRFNYNINFGVWDAIEGDKDGIESFSSNLNDYDVIFLPQIKRWSKHLKLFSEIKQHKIKSVLFDNDSCYRSFKDDIYKGIDYIFYKDLDRNKEKPIVKSSLLRWSIDTEKYKPVYGGSGISFNCNLGDYPLRKSIKGFLKHTKYKGQKYITNLQCSAGAIHTDSPRVKAVRAKILEFAACGTHIISNRTSRMDLYFPDDLIIYFEDVKHLKQLLKSFKPDISIQKRLRDITVEKHDDRVRAKEVIEILNIVFVK